MTDRIQELRDFFSNIMMNSYEIGPITGFFGWMDEEMLQATPAEHLSAYLFAANAAVDSWVGNVRDTPDDGEHGNHEKWQSEQIAAYEALRPKNKRLAELQVIFAGA
jgi:hypothetical protein